MILKPEVACSTVSSLIFASTMLQEQQEKYRVVLL